jgi:hypothetical protein
MEYMKVLNSKEVKYFSLRVMNILMSVCSEELAVQLTMQNLYL